MKPLLLVLTVLLLQFGEILAQSSVLPSILTNRRMGFPGDASAVAWNPALLGVRSGENEFLAAYDHDKTLKDSLNRWSLFGKLGPFALGYVPGIDPLLPAEYLAGIGFSLTNSNSLRMGLSFMYRNDKDSSKGISDNLRGNASLIYTPLRSLWLSGGISNIHEAGADVLVGSAALAYTPLSWAGLFAHLDIAGQDNFFLKDNIDAQLGLTISPTEGFVASAMYNPIQESFRIGLEANFGGFSVGELVNQPKEGDWRGVMLIRWQGDEYNDLPRYIADGAPSTSSSSNRRDAQCRVGPYKWTHGLAQVTAPDLMSKMQFAGSEYSSLYAKLQSLSPDIQQLYAKIGSTYYGMAIPTEATTPTNSSLVRAVAGHRIVVDSVINEQNGTTVIFRVRDGSNRNVSNLKKDAFYLTDTTKQIIQFAQTASQKRVAADFMILMDCSGSMSSSIASVRTNVQNFSRSLANRNIDFRVGSILFNQEVFATLPPTNNLNEFSTFFSQAVASGYDEITSEAIAQSADVAYRPDAEKIAILITDDCSLQDNTTYTEEELITKLWNKGVHLYGVVNPNNHNAGFTTRLTLGKEYDIKSPFNSILDDISGEITTTYQLTYNTKPKVELPKTMLRGVVQSESGWKLNAAVEAVIDGTSRQTHKTNALSGEYEFEVPKGKRVDLTVSADDHSPEKANLTVPNLNRNDTLVQNFTLKQPKTILRGVVTDENKKPLAAKIKIEDATTLALIKEIETGANGTYSVEMPEGNIYRLTPSVKEYIPSPADVDMRTTKKGSVVTQDLMLTSIAVAVEKGMTFRLKNIFFDSGKWDLRPESFEELNKLLSFMGEYQSVRIEIGAHTDNVGKDDANMVLSQKRAQSVVDYLKGKGITESRMMAKGYGKTVPVADNATPEGKQLNRRVEFKLIK